MPVFAVTTARDANWNHARDIRDQPFWAEHASFADQLVDRGVIIIGGPVGSEDPEDIALLAVEAADEEAVRAIFDDDPWTAHHVFRIKDVRPWSLWLDGRSIAWTAPKITRQSAPYVADERQMLEGWLDFHRQTLLGKCSGLTAEQLRQRAAPPSSLSLLGLVRHMAEVERGWFRRRVAGEDVGFLYSSEADPDGEFDHVDTADPEQDFATYLDEIAAARQAAASHGLDERFRHSHRNAEMSVRWVYVHMVEEYARHNGHADLLRERIDGATGL
jgi:uncharacterized protein YciI/uncharacterized damage-inducible protein DinB